MTIWLAFAAAVASSLFAGTVTYELSGKSSAAVMVSVAVFWALTVVVIGLFGESWTPPTHGGATR